jgi:diadenosine tetraphosphate (Ap4A) HIT family hydrolase
MSEQLQRLWAGWRAAYLDQDPQPMPASANGCVLCAVIEAALQSRIHLIHEGATSVVILNAFPYNSGHVLVLPKRHLDAVDGLTAVERDEFWALATDASSAIKAAYRPGGVNFGVNEGAAAGAGIPAHLHAHVLPRWNSDTNFMTTVAGARVMPESLDATADRLRLAWRRSDG